MAKIRFNYNGEPLKAGEVLVAHEYDPLFAEANVTNPECVRTIRKAGRNFKVLYKAVPEEWAPVAKSQFNLVQNEQFGHYDIPNSTSMDAVEDDYDLSLASTPSAEEQIIGKEDAYETAAGFKERMQRIIKQSPKHGFAMLLVCQQVNGAEFAEKIRLKRNQANEVLREAKELLYKILKHIEVGDIKAYKSKNADYYREEAEKLLELILSIYF